MIEEIFKDWIKKTEELTEIQVKRCAEKLQLKVAGMFEDGRLETEMPPSIAEAVPDCCPHCSHDKMTKWGQASGLQRWKCKDCARTFNALTKTPFARLRRKDRWLANSQAMIDGLSLRRTADICGVHYNTTFRWRHRFAQVLCSAQSQELSGIAECDITFFYDSEPGAKKLDRKPRKRGGDGIPSGIGKHQIAVITICDRNGKVAERVAAEKVRLHACDLYKVHLDSDTLLLTDGDTELCAAVKDVCKAAEERNPVSHIALPGKAKSRGKKDNPYHIQTANSFHSHLKRWMSRFHGVATKYLGNYVGWHRHLMERHHKDDPNLFIKLVLKPLAVNPQLTVI